MDQKCIHFLDNNVMMRCGGSFFFCATGLGTVRQLDAGMSETGGLGEHTLPQILAEQLPLPQSWGGRFYPPN